MCLLDAIHNERMIISERGGQLSFMSCSSPTKRLPPRREAEAVKCRPSSRRCKLRLARKAKFNVHRWFCSDRGDTFRSTKPHVEAEGPSLGCFLEKRGVGVGSDHKGFGSLDLIQAYPRLVSSLDWSRLGSPTPREGAPGFGENLATPDWFILILTFLPRCSIRRRNNTMYLKKTPRRLSTYMRLRCYR